MGAAMRVWWKRAVECVCVEGWLGGCVCVRVEEEMT